MRISVKMLLEYEADHILHVIDSDVLGNENGVVNVADINNPRIRSLNAYSASPYR